MNYLKNLATTRYSEVDMIYRQFALGKSGIHLCNTKMESVVSFRKTHLLLSNIFKKFRRSIPSDTPPGRYGPSAHHGSLQSPPFPNPGSAPVIGDGFILLFFNRFPTSSCNGYEKVQLKQLGLICFHTQTRLVAKVVRMRYVRTLSLGRAKEATAAEA